MNIENVPHEVKAIIKKLEDAGYEAYIVGGCVRDLVVGVPPKDWDVTTSALPEEIIKLFPDSFYENKFGTVGVKTDSEYETLKVVEVTTFRTEATYSDMRHPDKVSFAKKLEDDLKRRDFTVNALAIQIQNAKSKNQNDNAKFKIIDLFGGRDDLKNKIIRAVGVPEERFKEDALRLIRAVRFATELGFAVEEKTHNAIVKNAAHLKAVSFERIREEFAKIIMTRTPSKGIETLRETGLLAYILPELLEGYGVGQNKHHIYTVWEHNLKSMDYGAKEKYPFHVRLAAMLHDVGKPRTKRGEGYDSTFYGHDVVGAKMAVKILERLRFSKEIVENVSKLIRYHLFTYDPEKGATDASVRRLVREVGEKNIEDLVRLRICDRIGSGVPKAVPYRLRHFQFRVEKVLREGEAVSLKLLKISGSDMMKLLGIPPGPIVGHVLNALLDEVIDEPEKNEKKYLEKRAKELAKLSLQELEVLRKKTKEKIELLEDQREEEIKKKHYVK